MEASYPVTASGLLVASPTDVQWQNCSQAAALNCSGGGDGGVPGGGPDGDDAVADDLTYRVTVAILLSIIILCTIVGNVFVVLAVVREKILHKTLANRLIGSLAVTDLLVAVLVMPLTAVTLITVVWPFGQVMCDFFVFIDVLFCTASILHLVAIAVDRYWTVTDVEYAQKVGKRQSLVFYAMVALAWGVAACVCIPPLFEWRNEYSEGVCRISQDIGYTVYSTLLAFYAPLLVIIAIYGKIFFLVRQRVRERLLSRRQLSEVNGGGAAAAAATVVADERTAATQPHPNGGANGGDNGGVCGGGGGGGDVAPTTKLLQPLPREPPTMTAFRCDDGQPYDNYEVTVNGPTAEAKEYAAAPPPKRRPCCAGADSSRKLMTSPLISRAAGGGGGGDGRHKASGGSGGCADDPARRWEKVAVKRERRALRTLLIITGIFVVCWLPFFVFAALMPFCRNCQVPKTVLDLVNWLGYCNSALNPIIYTIFSPDFRKAFRKILLGQYRCAS